MIVEGKNCAYELLKANYKIEKIILTKETDDKVNEIISLAKFKNVPCEIVDKKEIEKITKSNHSQGVISFVKPYKYYDLFDILKSNEKEGKQPFLVLLDGITDPHNLGAIIRTAECLGVDAVVIPQNRSCEINETVFKTSAGAIAHIKVAQVVNLSQTIEKLKDKNIWCYALEAGNSSLTKANLTGGIALVVGSEGKGVSRLVAKTCDDTLSIPMFGQVNSLNASNAAAIAMFEVSKQRNN